VPARDALRRLAGRGGGERQLDLPVPHALLDVLRDGPAPLAPSGDRERERLSVAVVIPAFRRASGGHATIAQLVRGLEQLGHACSLWIEDDEGRHAGAGDHELQALFEGFFGPVAGPIRKGFGAWSGADVVMATGWQTVPRALLLSDAGARAYLVQDHEPEFYPTSAERMWAEWTYRQGLHCICASPWLASLVRDRYDASATPFHLGVEHARYKPRPAERRDDLVLFYARAVTPRRAVPLGLLALTELHRRRPGVEIALFGETRPLRCRFAHRDLGVLEPAQLAREYASATVGLVLSLTNPSLIPQEMLASGLPVVDVASQSMVACFGSDGPVELAEPDPLALCAAIERLLDDPALRARRERLGAAWVAGRTWAAAAAQVERGLREATRGSAAAEPRTAS
jgi:glycosyltransferase involved in cell wall biosynthesis